MQPRQILRHLEPGAAEFAILHGQDSSERPRQCGGQPDAKPGRPAIRVNAWWTTQICLTGRAVHGKLRIASQTTHHHNFRKEPPDVRLHQPRPTKQPSSTSTAVSKVQDASLEAVSTFAVEPAQPAARSSSPRCRSKDLPTAEEITAAYFSFTEKLVANQKAYTERFFAAVTPAS